MTASEEFFVSYRKNILGIEQEFDSPFGKKKIIYADWIASGRLYTPIEKKMTELFGPFVGNTHSEASITGVTMTHSYLSAREIIKEHVNANKDDIIITAGSGMTGVVNKLQRILGLRIPEQLKDFTNLPKELKPVVFITHMEHHSNQTSWLETIADVIILEPDELGLVNPESLKKELEKFSDRKLKIGAFTSCSNVTGIRTPYHQLAKIMHQNNGYCFIDFACSAPYDPINMHPSDELEKLDAIFFSPHKFLGGPGTPGVLIFDSKLYHNKIPDNPGGGTVDWTNPWGQHKFVNSIEAREDGGTPPFLQTIKAALAIKLKEEMTSEKIVKREEELVKIVFDELEQISSLHILAAHIKHRIGAISFYVDNIHYNLLVKILNDRYGIQVRGGCSCAGTYGHYLLHVDQNYSNKITEKISHGDLSEKPGWVRLSLHPTMSNDEVYFITSAIKETILNIDVWNKDYNYDIHTNEFFHKSQSANDFDFIKKWF
ncbi:MAG: aminotransferase class V-fold PLP-dependent enzyme [Ignavibacteriaceae bacterium]|nr:aminotransferase class V-fold PLP-dependent enzyme [Ignavibacteriaceae bacterium]